MMWVLLLVIAVVMPFAVLWQAVRAIRRASRGRRLGASLPLVMVLIALAVQVRSFKTDPMGHGGQFIAGMGLMLLASLLAYLQGEYHDHQQGDTPTPPQP